MAEEVPKQCDLCNQINLKRTVSLDRAKMEMLEIVVSDFLDKRFFYLSVICKTCDGLLRAAFDFKSKYLVNLDKMKDYIHPLTKQVNLRALAKCKSKDSTFQLKPGQRLCRICLTILNRHECKHQLLPSRSMNMVQACLPGLKITNSHRLFVCLECQSSLQLYQHILSLCLDAFPESIAIVKKKKREWPSTSTKEKKTQVTDPESMPSKKSRTHPKPGVSAASDNSSLSEAEWPEDSSLDFVKDIRLDKFNKECFKCLYCSFTCASETEMSKHVKLHEDSDIEVYSCSYCDYSTICLKQIEKHQLQHKTVPNDTHASREIPASGRARCSAQSHECPLCAFKFVSLEDYVQHSCRNKSDNGTKNPTGSRREGYVRRHFRELLETLGPTENCSPSGPRKCQCCGESCPTEDDFKIHLNYCDKLYRCNSCSYKCEKSHELELHGWQVHGAVPLVCKYCQYSTAMVENYQAHTLLAHQESKLSDILEAEDETSELGALGSAPFVSTPLAEQPSAVGGLGAEEAELGGVAEPPACETIVIADSESDSEFVETSLKESQSEGVVTSLNATEVCVINAQVASELMLRGVPLLNQVDRTSDDCPMASGSDPPLQASNDQGYQCNECYFRSSNELKIAQHQKKHPLFYDDGDSIDCGKCSPPDEGSDVPNNVVSIPPKVTRRRYPPSVKGLGQKAFRLFSRRVSKQFAELYPQLKSFNMFQLVSKSWRDLTDNERLSYYEEVRIEQALLRRERIEELEELKERGMTQETGFD